MDSMFDLRQSLIKAFEKIESGDIDLKQAKALVSTSSNIINTVKTQLKYHELRQEKPDISFVEKAKGK